MWAALIPLLTRLGGAVGLRSLMGAGGGRAIAGLVGGGEAAGAAEAGAAKEGSSFASLAANSKNFGALLSGQKTSEGVRDEAKQEEADQAKQQAAEKWTQTLNKLTLGGTALGIALVKLPGLLGKFGENILNGQEYLRRFNGQINTAFARLERQQIQLQYGRAGATSDSLKFLADQQMSFREDSEEIKRVMQAVWNYVSGAVTFAGRVGTTILKWHPLFMLLKYLVNIDENTKKDSDGMPWRDFLNDMADGKFSGFQRDRKTPWGPGGPPQPHQLGEPPAKRVRQGGFAQGGGVAGA